MAYYEQQRLGLGRDLQQEVERATSRIQQHPQGFPQHHALGLRTYFLRRFPYTIFYLELADQIWIAVVAHQRRLALQQNHRHDSGSLHTPLSTLASGRELAVEIVGSANQR